MDLRQWRLKVGEVFQPRHDLLQRPPVPLAHRLEFVRVAATMIDHIPQDRPAVRQDLLVYLLSPSAPPAC
jgi:hypothetical protein